MRHATGAVLLVALLAFCGPAVAAGATPSDRMVDAINDARERASLPPLHAAPRLERSAGAFARFLLRHEQLHHRPNVSTTRRYPRSRSLNLRMRPMSCPI